MVQTRAAAKQINGTDHFQNVSSSYSLDKIKNIFFIECEHVLSELDTSLRAVSNGEVDRDIIETIFRSIHLVHEGAAALGLKELEAFARVFDNTLNKMCTDQLDMTHFVFQILLQSSDMLTQIFKASRDDQKYNLELAASLIHQLETCIRDTDSNSLQDSKQDALSIEDINFQPIKLDFEFCTTPIGE